MRIHSAPFSHLRVQCGAYMNRTALTLGFFLTASVAGIAQAPQKAVVNDKLAVTTAVAPDAAVVELAKATLAAHGGEKLKGLKSLMAKGSVDLNAMGQAMPGAFSTAFSGDKYYFEIISPAQQLKQVFDGTQTYTSVQGIALPPVTSLGFPVLSRIGDAGFVISAPGDGKKKAGKGFRITTPEGYYTDFYINEKSKQLKSYDSAYDMGGGRLVTTSVEFDEFENVDGVLVPKKFSQRFDLGPITAYANFKTKQILVNSKMEDSAFAMPK
jgi:hypothetical protein